MYFILFILIFERSQQITKVLYSGSNPGVDKETYCLYFFMVMSKAE